MSYLILGTEDNKSKHYHFKFGTTVLRRSEGVLIIPMKNSLMLLHNKNYLIKIVPAETVKDDTKN